MLTLSLWFLSFAIGAITFNITKDKLTLIGRIVFSIMLILTVWVSSTYAAWLIGFEISIGTVKSDLMAENWWLPIVTIVWTILTYFAFRADSTHN